MAAQEKMRRKVRHRNEGHPRNGFPGNEPLIDAAIAHRALVYSDNYKTLRSTDLRNTGRRELFPEHEPNLLAQQRTVAPRAYCHRGEWAFEQQVKVILEAFAKASPEVA
jgi:hypothetical protein